MVAPAAGVLVPLTASAAATAGAVGVADADAAAASPAAAAAGASAVAAVAAAGVALAADVVFAAGVAFAVGAADAADAADVAGEGAACACSKSRYWDHAESWASSRGLTWKWGRVIRRSKLARRSLPRRDTLRFCSRILTNLSLFSASVRPSVAAASSAAELAESLEASPLRSPSPAVPAASAVEPAPAAGGGAILSHGVLSANPLKSDHSTSRSLRR